MGLAVLALWQPGAFSQTTQGLITGRILNSRDGRPVGGAEVHFLNPATNDSGGAPSQESGYFALPLLSPGQYEIRVTAPAYQSQEVQELELRVSGRIELNFLLRPLTDVWESGEYRSVFLPGSKTIVTYFGPDVDSSKSGTFEANTGKEGTLQSSISDVVSPKEIEDLPLAGRDVFDMLVTQPGVTADTTTARSLGLSANGQRSATSTFLLDGLEFNNYLVSGPVSAVAPEAIQEYRLSTSNFSAEYGGTAGYVANAVTKAGTSEWHGVGYFDLKNDVLNANDFQSNLNGIRREPDKEDEPGFQVGGPILSERLFFSASLDYFRSRSLEPPETMTVPTTYLFSLTPATSMARTLLTEFPGPQVTAGTNLTAPITVTPPVSINRWLGLARADYLLDGGKHRIMFRPVVSRTSRPDFIWTPYPAFVTGADDNAYGFAIGAQSLLRANLTNEARLGGTWTVFNLPRNHPDVPLVTVPGVELPSSPDLFTTFDNRNRTGQLIDNLVWSHGPHLITAGGGLLLRGITGTLSPDDNGEYAFQSIGAFAVDRVLEFRAPVDRNALPAFQLPQFGRQYRQTQGFFFLQDTFRVTSRLVVNLGVRYDAFGSPQNTGPNKDTLVELGAGSTLAERVANATLFLPGSGNEAIYHSQKNNFAPRVGFSYSPPHLNNTVIRGGYGIYYDRFFDNIWQNLRNNTYVLSTYNYVASQPPYLTTPIPQVLPYYAYKGVDKAFANYSQQSIFGPLTLFQPNLRTPYVQSFFFGIQQRLATGWTMEANALGSLGRELLTQDVINRDLAGELGQPINYRANQGDSDYSALAVVLRHTSAHAQFQVAYTWSHAIDNQSEVLRSDYFNLSPTVLTTSQLGRLDISAFSQEYNGSSDRGNADFDQRQNLVFFSVFNLPAVFSSTKEAVLFRGWTFSQLAAFRSGAPFTVFAGLPYVLPYNTRAELVNPAALSPGTPVAGGVQVLSAAAFANPAPGTMGNTGRNEFTGPGFYNIDISISRSFALPWLGESGRLTFRADAFNFLNHANLNVPNFNLASGFFGVATYGRTQPSTNAALPVLSPVNDTGRQIQLIVRVTF